MEKILSDPHYAMKRVLSNCWKIEFSFKCFVFVVEEDYLRIAVPKQGLEIGSSSVTDVFFPLQFSLQNWFADKVKLVFGKRFG